MNIPTVALLLALVTSAFALASGAGWAERICAAALLLRATLELAALLILLHAAFSADRWFPLVMAAAALIGCTARALGFSGLGGAHLPLLQMTALPLLAMTLALGTGLAARGLPRSLSNAST